MQSSELTTELQGGHCQPSDENLKQILPLLIIDCLIRRESVPKGWDFGVFLMSKNVTC